MDEKTIDSATYADNTVSAEIMAGILMGGKVSTYGMYDRLATEFLSGTDEFREGLDRAVEIITGESLTSLARKILKNSTEAVA